MQIFKSLLFLSAASLVLASCNKDDNDNNNDDNNDLKASVKIELSHNFEGESFELDKYYTLGNGSKVKFTTAQFYLSNVAFMDDADNRTKLEPQFTFVESTTSEIDLGEVDAGHMHMLMLNLGVDEKTNTTVLPTDFEDLNAPLAPKTNSMHWSWNSGYIFYKFEGDVDTDGDGTDDDSFKYHIGLNDNLITKSKMAHTDLEAGKSTDIMVKVDYAKIFSGLDLSTELITMTMNNPELATKIKTNFEAAVEIETHDHN